MTLLAIDTTGPDCSVALRVPEGADVVLTEPIGRGHAERLAPMVETVLAQAGLQARDLSRIGVTIGPGSFAGTRVGTAFARGLALALGVPAVGVGNLAIIAHMALPRRPLAVLHDAKRGEVILQVWRQNAASPTERLAVAEAGDRIRTLAGPDAWLAGSGAALIAAEGIPDTGMRHIDMTVLLDLAASADPQASPPSPFYARPPDAKLPGGIEPA